VECYNDGEIGLVINDNITKKIVYNEDILDFNFSNFITKIEEIIKKEECKNE
jgi:phosphatidylinositol kinase/protein kinase (PI-3  family)